MIREILERSQTGFHPCGTTRLGKSIQQGVVDLQLRVYGNKALRVIDASVFPVITDCRVSVSSPLVKASTVSVYILRSVANASSFPTDPERCLHGGGEGSRLYQGGVPGIVQGGRQGRIRGLGPDLLRVGTALTEIPCSYR